MELGLSGLASGFDWRSLVDQLVEVERTPQLRLAAEQNRIRQRNNAYGSIETQLKVLQNRVTSLKDASLYSSRLTSVADSSVATATASAGAALGTYTFSISQLATASRQTGTANIGAALHPTNDVSGLVLSNASFSTAVTAGTFTVNGRQITLAATDTLQGVFDKISVATGGAVTGSYDSATDKISLSGSGPIILGSGTDTSNFLAVARLYNNGTDSISSASALGSVKRNAALQGANLSAAISDGGSGAGVFKINGVAISFNAAQDSLQNVLDRINNSGAGVSASYDTINDRLSLTSKSTGDMGIALEDVTGNFLSATGLAAGSLARGKNLLYSIDGGSTLVSQSNTIDESSSGLAGVSVTALAEGATSVTVASDTAKIRTAISSFVTDYNALQSLIDTQTASSTDAKGKVTAGLLAGERDADEIGRKLRGIANAVVSSLTGSVKSLADLGISSNGNDNKLEITGTKLDAALTGSLPAVQSIFTDSEKGISTQLDKYLESMVGDEGALIKKQDNLTKAAAKIDTDIADLERIVQANRDAMILSFVAMEKAQASMNQQLTYLQRIGGQT